MEIHNFVLSEAKYVSGNTNPSHITASFQDCVHILDC